MSEHSKTRRKTVAEQRTRMDELVTYAFARMTDSKTRAQLSRLPHPHKLLAKQGRTRLAWADFRMTRGTKERAEVGSFLEKLEDRLCDEAFKQLRESLDSPNELEQAFTPWEDFDVEQAFRAGWKAARSLA